MVERSVSVADRWESRGAGEQGSENPSTSLDTIAESGNNGNEAQLNSGNTDDDHPTKRLSDQPATMEVTPEHPVYVEGKGWLWAENFSIGDRLRRSDGGWAKVLAVERVTSRQTAVAEAKQVYNFTVKGPHTYFVLEVGVLVHNACVPAEGLEQRWQSAGHDVNNPAIQRFVERGYAPEDVPANLRRNLEASAAGREASGFDQWVEDVEKSEAIENIQQQKQQRLQEYWQQHWEQLRKQYNIPEHAQRQSIYDVEPWEGDQNLRIWLGTGNTSGRFDRAGNKIDFASDKLHGMPYVFGGGGYEQGLVVTGQIK